MHKAKVNVSSGRHRKHKSNVISMQNFLMLNLVVRIVTVGFKMLAYSIMDGNCTQTELM